MTKDKKVAKLKANSTVQTDKLLKTGKDIIVGTKDAIVVSSKVLFKTGKKIAKFIKKVKDNLINAEDLNKKREHVNIVCLKYGVGYGPEYVNKLFNMVLRNITIPFRFYCFTEDATGLDNRIIIKPIPQMYDKDGKPVKEYNRWTKEAGFCDNNLGGPELKGKRVLFLDLDVVITGNIDGFFSYHEKDDDFIITNDWNTRGNRVGQASCYSFKVGTLGEIKKYYEQHSDEIKRKYKTASQEYLSDKVRELTGKPLKFWPKHWVKSFKKHCMPCSLLRFFITPKLPADAKIICFHGYPNPGDAMVGRWTPESERVPFLKRWYKHVRPTKWIEEYWR